MNRTEWHAGKRRPIDRGFSLIELVTAAAIFSILGVMLFSMIRTGMSMWKEGEVSRNLMERGVRVLETISRELRLAFTENDSLSGEAANRFICDFFDYDRDGDGKAEARVQRLRFIRINAEERENAVLRTSGDEPLGRHYFTLFEEDPKLIEEEGTLPTGGLAEAMFMSYAPRLNKGERREGLLYLYRGYRSPPGGLDSYFATGNLARAEDIENQLLPVLDGLIYLEFRFWNQHTLSFDSDLAPPDSPQGAGYTWDSTRALLPMEALYAPNTFRFFAGESSLSDATDDLFPSRVQITVVVEEPQDLEQLPRLVNKVNETEMRLPLDVARLFTRVDKKDRFVRIDEEWIEYSRVEGGELVVSRRGARNTFPAPHAAGGFVHMGRRFSTVVEIPTAKTDWNED